jgi:hypothetical protein
MKRNGLKIQTAIKIDRSHDVPEQVSPLNLSENQRGVPTGEWALSHFRSALRQALQQESRESPQYHFRFELHSDHR